MKEGSSVLVPRTSGEWSPGTIVLVQDNWAMVEFPLGATYRGGESPDPNKIGSKVVSVNELLPIPERNSPKIAISEYLQQGGIWEIGESQLAWHGNNEVVVTRVNKRWFNLRYLRSGAPGSANIAYLDHLLIAAEKDQIKERIVT